MQLDSEIMKALENAPSAPSRRLHISVKGVSGLFLRVHPSGKRTWTTITRDKSGKQIWVTLGDAVVLDASEVLEAHRSAFRRVRLGEHVAVAEVRKKRKAAKQSRDYRARNPQAVSPERLRNAALKTKYGITHADYEALLKAQDGRCKICGSESPKSSRSQHFFVDHNHETGGVRGLLCKPCNSGIGLLGDDHTQIWRAASYVRAGEAHARAILRSRRRRLLISEMASRPGGPVTILTDVPHAGAL